jgi:hypothetical protein
LTRSVASFVLVTSKELKYMKVQSRLTTFIVLQVVDCFVLRMSKNNARKTSIELMIVPIRKSTMASDM